MLAGAGCMLISAVCWDGWEAGDHDDCCIIVVVMIYILHWIRTMAWMLSCMMCDVPTYSILLGRPPPRPFEPVKRLHPVCTPMSALPGPVPPFPHKTLPLHLLVQFGPGRSAHLYRQGGAARRMSGAVHTTFHRRLLLLPVVNCPRSYHRG